MIVLALPVSRQCHERPPEFARGEAGRSLMSRQYLGMSTCASGVVAGLVSE